MVGISRKILTAFSILALVATYSFPLTVSASIKKVTLLRTTGAGTYTMPSDWNPYDNSIEAIAGGGGGGSGGTGGIGSTGSTTPAWQDTSTGFIAGPGGGSGGGNGTDGANGALFGSGGGGGEGTGGSGAQGIIVITYIAPSKVVRLIGNLKLYSGTLKIFPAPQ